MSTFREEVRQIDLSQVVVQGEGAADGVDLQRGVEC